MSFVGLSLSYSNNRLGAALYDKDTGVLSILEDVPEDSSFQSLDSLLFETNPTLVTINASQSDDFIKFVTDKSNEPYPSYSEDELDDGNIVPETQLGLDKDEQPNNEFSDDSDMVPETQLSDVCEDNRNRENVSTKRFDINEYPSHSYATATAIDMIDKMYETGQYESAGEGRGAKDYIINKNCVNMIQSLGVLLKTLDHYRVGVEYEENSVKTPIKCIKSLSISKLLEVDRATLLALNILDNEYSPSVTKLVGRKWGNKPKRGISMLKICNQCSSSLGKAMLTSWFERPSADLETIVNRHDALEFFISEQRINFVKEIKRHLRNVVTLEPVFRRLRGGVIRSSDWKSVFKTITSAHNIGEILISCDCSLKLIPNYRDCCSKEILHLAVCLNETIDFDMINKRNKFAIKKGIDTEVDGLKNLYSNISFYLDEIARDELNIYENIYQCRVIFTHSMGYVVIVPSDVPISSTDGVTLMLIDNGDNYYKTPKMVKLDNELGDVKQKIKDLELNYMLRAQKLIIDNIGKIRSILKTLSIIDCVLSLAYVSRELKWCRPTMINDPILDICEARHPIAECLTKESYVPNPILSGGCHTKVKLITGPNASGKSVYLKMTAICCYMAQVGCFIPATSATMGVVDKIIVRMYTLDSVLDRFSIFAKELIQMGRALNRGTGKSLVIIDEFGIGTLKETGISLFASCLNYWINKGKDNCPHIFASSHFHSLPKYVNGYSSILSYHTMAIHQESSVLKFFYQITTGKIERSFANHIAYKMGLPRSVLDHSENVYKLFKEGVDICSIPKLNYDDDEKDGCVYRIFSKFILQYEKCQHNDDYLQFFEVVKNECLNTFYLDASEKDKNDNYMIKGYKSSSQSNITFFI